VKLTNATDRRDAEQKAGLRLTRQEQAYGTTEECIAHVQRLIDAGAHEIMFLTPRHPLASAEPPARPASPSPVSAEPPRRAEVGTL
jgi:hypothetical protein